mmetsp:Transcript_2802/g.3465  ORF Transcript_2802/g.3465 Transcript_2802/m.3465 type:complete len:130 (+) Transcript_2802:30-419(+)
MSDEVHFKTEDKRQAVFAPKIIPLKKAQKSTGARNKSNLNKNTCLTSVAQVQANETEQVAYENAKFFEEAKNIAAYKTPKKYNNMMNHIQSNKIKFLLNCKDLLNERYKKKSTASQFHLYSDSREGPLT